MPFYGTIVACADDAHLRQLLPAMTRRVITYGLDAPDAHYRGVDVSGAGFDWRCTVVRDGARRRGRARAGR